MTTTQIIKIKPPIPPTTVGYKAEKQKDEEIRARPGGGS